MRYILTPIITLLFLGILFSSTMEIFPSFHSLIIIFIFFFLYGVGGIIQGVIFNHPNSFFLPFLTGVILTSSLIYLLLFFAPVIPPVTILILFFCTLIGLICCKKKFLYTLYTQTLDGWECFGIIIALGASLLWNQESLSPWSIHAEQRFFAPWIDSFYHMSWIVALSKAPLLGYVQDIRTTGTTQYFYHAAQYSLPAIFVFSGAISALKAYLSFLVPFSMFLMGGAAFCLGNFFKDFRSGFFAIICTLLIPSASVLGPHLYWFDYHWILAISPSLSFGITSTVLSYLFLICSCKERSFKKIIFSWGFSLLSIVTKFHLFVVNAPLLLLLPAFVYPGVRIRSRIMAVFTMSCVFFIALHYAHALGLSVFNFDGTAFSWYARLLLSFDTSGTLKDFLNITLSSPPTIVTILKMCCFVIFGSFGILFLFWVVSAQLLFREHLLFAFITLCSLGVYLLFSLSGSIFSTTFGNPEEFMHRPFVWSYFLLCVGGALILSKLSPKVQQSRIVVLSSLGLLIPFYLGTHLQSGPHFGLNNIEIPEGLFRTTEYLKQHVSPYESFLITDRDPYWIASALSEQQLFAQDSGNKNFRKLELLENRLSNVSQLLTPGSFQGSYLLLKELNIDWLVTTPDVYRAFKDNFKAPLMFENNEFMVFKIK